MAVTITTPGPQHIDAVVLRGNSVELTAAGYAGKDDFSWEVSSLTPGVTAVRWDALDPRTGLTVTFHTDKVDPGDYSLKATRTNASVPETGVFTLTVVTELEPIEGIRRIMDRVATDGLRLNARPVDPSNDQALWVSLRACTDRRSFPAYNAFIDHLLCGSRSATSKGGPRAEAWLVKERDRRPDCLYKHGVNGYELLKAATEVFLVCHACCDQLRIKEETFNRDEERDRLGYASTAAEMDTRLQKYLAQSVTRGTLPYLDLILQNLDLQEPDPNHFPFCEDSVRSHPCLYELIWSYWHEEGMLVQTLSAIGLRFQNRPVPVNGRDALANFELAPLRPLNNLLWGYVQDRQDRLTVTRRGHEYEHEYGLKLFGKAVGPQQAAENRSKFLEAFHNLLRQTAEFYRDGTNLLNQPDAFPLLNAIRGVHLLLAEGAHNQFGDLPSTARKEMLIEQWLLAQQPMREFLQSRAMVPYDEPWMGQVDAMKKLMGWPDVTVIHFHNLAVMGERILLSLRYGNWSNVNTTAAQANNWAIYWRTEIQGYIEAYRAVTGVDLSSTTRQASSVDATLPSIHLQRRLDLQRQFTRTP